MLRYTLKKLAYGVLTLYGVVTVIFFLFHFLPGDPARMMLGQNESADQLAAVNKKYGFDQPLSTQYWCYLNDLSPISWHSTAEGDFTHYRAQDYGGWILRQSDAGVLVLKAPYLRDSFQKSGKKVTQVIAETLPNTAILAVSSITLAMLLGLLLGVISVWYKDRWLDRFIQMISTVGMSVPSFFSAILFAWFFGYVLHEYTHLNMTGSLIEVDDFGEGTYIAWKNLLLPAVVLGIRPIAVVTQLMRNSLWEQMQLDYIRTAKAKGLTTWAILWKH
ncbi:MAG: ABC transporter permease, partial [Flavobacteriaceae bacterium]